MIVLVKRKKEEKVTFSKPSSPCFDSAKDEDEEDKEEEEEEED